MEPNGLEFVDWIAERLGVNHPEALSALGHWLAHCEPETDGVSSHAHTGDTPSLLRQGDH